MAGSFSEGLICSPLPTTRADRNVRSTLFVGTTLTKSPYLRLTPWGIRLSPGSGETVMRHLALLPFALVLLITAALADDWSKTYNVEHTPQLRVDTSDADIRL